MTLVRRRVLSEGLPLRIAAGTVSISGSYTPSDRRRGKDFSPSPCFGASAGRDRLAAVLFCRIDVARGLQVAEGADVALPPN